MASGLELTLGNCFSHSSSLKKNLTLKRSFIFICSNMGIGLFSHKISLEGTWDHTATFPYDVPLLWGVRRWGCGQLLRWLHYQQAEQLLHWIISLLLTTAVSVKRAVWGSLPWACATTVLQSSTLCGDNRHYYSGGMQMSTGLDAVQIRR